MYLRKDHENALQELKCYEYLKEQASILLELGKFDEALIYHDNMIRSINELKKMHNEKLMIDQAKFILKQIESTEQHHQLMKKLRASQ